MLKDYYKGMQTPMPDEWLKDIPKLALIDVRLFILFICIVFYLKFILFYLVEKC